jgi:23S rRNA (guanosine2251-2'-O)-methyltransferase
LETVMRRHSHRPRRAETAPTSEVIFGVNPVREALRGSPESLTTLYYVPGTQAASIIADEARSCGVVIESADRERLDELSRGGHHQGVAVRTRPFAFVDFEDLLGIRPALLVVLDGITDPQNLGAIMRSAEVLGAGGLILPKDRSAGVTPAVIRASSGATAYLRVARVVNVVRAMEQIKESGYWTVGLDAEGGSQFRDLPSFDRAVIVVGGEGTGIRPLVARACDFTVAIPVRGRVSSLNASAAAAIGIHEIAGRLGRSS